MKPLILLLLIAASVGATGLVIAGLHGYGPLAYISYNVQTSNSNQIIPAYINLGSLTPGQSGTVTANATIMINQNGTYEIKLLHVEKLSKVFTSFNVTVTIGKETITLNLNHDEQYLNLTSGKYLVVIVINYTVSTHPHGDLHVKNEPLLIIHPEGEQDNS